MSELTSFDVCKVCGCKETIAQRIMDKLKSEGKLSKDLEPAIIHQRVPMRDPRMEILYGVPVPMLISIIDGCAECGTLRVIKYGVATGTALPKGQG